MNYDDESKLEAPPELQDLFAKAQSGELNNEGGSSRARSWRVSFSSNDVPRESLLMAFEKVKEIHITEQDGSVENCPRKWPPRSKNYLLKTKAELAIPTTEYWAAALE
jgi:hypothetical protein